MRSRLARLAAALALAGAPALAAALTATPLYRLSDASGPVAMDWATLAHDATTHEVLAVDGGIVRVFNATGMQTYAFGDDPALGTITSLVVLESGQIVALSRSGAQWSLLRCSFRGELLGRIEPKGLPPAFAAGFTPGVLRRRGDALYLAELGSMRVLVLGLDGSLRAAHDLRESLGLRRDSADAAMGGFDVGAEGDLLFTLPMLFRAHSVSPGGEVRAWGRAGSAPGRFNVVAGIADAGDGRVLVVDSLRSVVMAFDREREFLGEFGYRGPAEHNLVAPHDVLVADGLVYVSQAGARGVSVFRLALDPAPPGGAGGGQ